jgi:EAL domain-containing protein (putative c-di-GMP-specific phosphodiesterase class I)
LAKALDLSVVAEGVETEASAARLAELGCETAQGYYFARPLTTDAFGERLRTHREACVLTR